MSRFLLFSHYLILNCSLQYGSDFQPICMHADAFQVTSEEIGKTPAVNKFPYNTLLYKETYMGGSRLQMQTWDWRTYSEGIAAC